MISGQKIPKKDKKFRVHCQGQNWSPSGFLKWLKAPSKSGLAFYLCKDSIITKKSSECQQRLEKWEKIWEKCSESRVEPKFISAKCDMCDNTKMAENS